MGSYTIGNIGLARAELAALLETSSDEPTVTVADDLDVAGAQLLASAVRTGRARGRPITIEMSAEGAAAALWRGLGLASLCVPHEIRMQDMEE